MGATPASVNAKNIGISLLVSDNAFNYAEFDDEYFGNNAALAADTHGNLYAAQVGRVYKIDSSGNATPIAGNGSTGFSDGGTVAANAAFGLISGLAVDANNNVYISDLINFCVWKVDQSKSSTAPGSLTRIAGTPTPLNAGFGFLNDFVPGQYEAGVQWVQSGDGDLAINAGLAPPSGLAVDGAGHLYILTALGIRKVDLNTGLISTVPLLGPYAEDLTYVSVERVAADYTPLRTLQHLPRQHGIRGQSAAQPEAFVGPTLASDAVDLLGALAITPTASYLYASNIATGSVYQIDLCTGNVTLVSALSPYGSAGGLAMDGQGNLYAATTTGMVEVANGAASASTVVPLTFTFGTAYSYPLALDTHSHLYYGYQQQVWQAPLPSGTPVVFAGDGSFNTAGDGPGLQASFSFPYGMAVDGNGNTYVSDSFNNRIRKIAGNGTISTVVGTGVAGNNGSSGPGTSFLLHTPLCLALDSTAQNLYIEDNGNNRVLQFNLNTGLVQTMAGGGNSPASVAGLGTSASIIPSCIAVNGGNLYINDEAVNGVDKVLISTDAISTTPLTIDSLGNSVGDLFAVAADSSGNFYLADSYYNVVYKMSGSTTTVFAGTYTVSGYSGDGGIATSATLNRPQGLALSSKDLYIVDAGNGRIRRVDLNSNTISTVAGTGQGFYTGDTAPPACSPVWPLIAAVDSQDDVFTADATGRILEISNALAEPATSVSELINVAPANEGLTFSVDNSPFTTPQTPTWTVGANHQLLAQSSQAGQPDGYNYSFVAWSEPSITGQKSVTAACPTTYTALYSTAGCSFNLSHYQASFDRHANQGYFFLNAPDGGTCSWIAQSSAGWITVTGVTAGSGSAVITYSVSPYVLAPAVTSMAAPLSGAFPPRTGTITVGGQTFTITQYPPGECDYSTGAAPYTPPELPSTNMAAGFFFLNLLGSCTPEDTWSLSATQPWVQLPAVVSGTGSPTISYTLTANSGVSARSADINVTGTSGSQMIPVPVSQVGNGIDLLVLPASLPALAAGEAEVVSVYSMGASCDPWTAVSNVPWITITSPVSGGGSGFGVVTFVVDANPGQQRQGTLTIAGQTIAINQGGSTTCQFGLTASSADAPMDGGTGSLSLTANNAYCYWTAISNQPWLTITSSIAGSGNATVMYSAAANSAAPRSASVSIGGQTFTVNQDGGYNVTFQTVPAGLQVMVDGSTLTSSTVMLSGSHTISVASPQAGASGTQYVFGNWSDSGAQSHSISVTAAATYTATFTTQYQLTISALPAAGGTVTPASGYFDAGTAVSISAAANSGYQFTSWTGSVASSPNASTSVTMSAPETVTANFVAATPITIQTSPAGLQFSVDGGPAMTAPQTENLSPGSHTIAIAGPQAGPPGTQYVFSAWSDSNSSNPRSITVGPSAATYTANFQTQYQLTISASPAAGGTVSPASGSYYNSDAAVNISATAANGYQFSSWSGSAASTSSASTTVTMSAPETVVANFASLTGITIQTSPPGLQFTVDGGPAKTAPQTLNLSPGAHTIAVAATQAGATGTQYVFTSWSDNGGASHSITVGSTPATYTASFSTQYQLTISASPAAGGTVSPASGSYYNSGAAVNISATSANGYQFSSWSGSAASTSSASTTVTMSAPETVVANFASLTGITIQTSPPGLQFSGGWRPGDDRAADAEPVAGRSYHRGGRDSGRRHGHAVRLQFLERQRRRVPLDHRRIDAGDLHGELRDAVSVDDLRISGGGRNSVAGIGRILQLRDGGEPLGDSGRRVRLHGLDGCGGERLDRLHHRDHERARNAGRGLCPARVHTESDIRERGGGGRNGDRRSDGLGGYRRMDGGEQQQLPHDHVGSLGHGQRDGGVFGGRQRHRNRADRHADHRRPNLHGEPVRRHDHFRAGLLSRDALPRGGYPQRRRALRWTHSHRRQHPQLHHPLQQLQHSCGGAGLLAQHHRRAGHHFGISDRVAGGAAAGLCFHVELLQRSHPGQRGHRAGRDGRRHQRLRQRRHPRDHRYQRLLRPAGIGWRAGLLPGGALPHRRYPERQRTFWRALIDCRRIAQFQRPAEQLQYPRQRAGIFAEYDRRAPGDFGLSDGVAGRPTAAVCIDAERPAGTDCG